MDKKIYTWDGIKALIKDQDYKHVKLSSLDGEKLVSYNSINKKAQGLADKLKEIEKRLKVLGDGIYIVTCQTKYGNTSPQVSHYLGIGNYDPSEIQGNKKLSENNPPQPPQPPARRNKSDELLTVDTALDNVQQIARLEATVERQKEEIARLKAENSELEAELDEMEAMGEDSPGSGVFEGLFPVAEKFLELEERKQKFKETKFLRDAGYEIPGLRSLRRSQSNGSRNGRRNGRRNGNAPRKQIPEPGTREWERYLQHLEGLSDQDFQAHINQLRDHAPDIYEEVKQDLEFEEEEYDDEPEEETEEVEAEETE